MMPSSEIHKTNTNRNENPYIELLFDIRGKKMGGTPTQGMPPEQDKGRAFFDPPPFAV